MRLIDADELIKGRVENDPVVIAAKCTPTAYDIDGVAKKIEFMSGIQFDAGKTSYQLDWCIDTSTAVKIVKSGMKE